MNISEANELNALLSWILGTERGATHESTTDDEARDAAAFLADKAHRALSAGLNANRVKKAWSGRRVRVVDELDLAEQLKLFPGGMRGIADAAGVATTVVYRFAWKEHRRPPVEIARKIAAAIRKRVRSGPLADLGDAEALIDAWRRSSRGRIRSAS